MQKIGVITINDFNNYGNRLQCYAVQRYLENMGYRVENIYNCNRKDGFIINCARTLYHYINDFKNRKTVAARERNFYEFNKNIKFSDESIICGHYNEDLTDKYDFFITGSDQVWNPYDSGRSETDFLNFASDDKKISFSASIGTDTLPDYVTEKYRKYLKNFKSISVREYTAKKIVEDLTGRKDVEVLADPTLLLTVEDWEKVMQKPSMNYNRKYILSYFLGGSKRYENVIKSIAEKYSCEIIDVYDKNGPFYSCGPQHFIDLEKNAFLICTDSFHSVVFAFLFNRPFIVFDRDNTKIDMNARMETLLSTFCLQQCRYKDGRNPEEYLAWDYSVGHKVLEKKREDAKKFITQALSPINLNDEKRIDNE